MTDVEAALKDLQPLLTAEQSAALHQNYCEAVALVDGDTELGYIAMVALMLDGHPDEQLVKAVRGTALVALGVHEYIAKKHPIPDTPEPLA